MLATTLFLRKATTCCASADRQIRPLYSLHTRFGWRFYAFCMSTNSTCWGECSSRDYQCQNDRVCMRSIAVIKMLVYRKCRIMRFTLKPYKLQWPNWTTLQSVQQRTRSLKLSNDSAKKRCQSCRDVQNWTASSRAHGKARRNSNFLHRRKWNTAGKLADLVKYRLNVIYQLCTML